MSDPDPRWDATLDALETEVAQLEFGLATGDLDQVAAAGPWRPPDDLSVLPAQLAGRVAQLAERMAAAEQQAREVRDQLGDQLGQLNTKRVANAAYLANDGPSAR